jgi:dienelactone hydrolase
VALVVDSFGPRGITTRCRIGLDEQPTDAYAALRYLSRQPSVDAARIVVLGYSMGGESALSIVVRGLIDRLFPEKFAAAVVYNPGCRGGSAWLMCRPLILTGAEDDRNPAAACREMLAQPHEGGAPIDLIVYPGTHHNFNFRVLTGPRYPGY